ncbi:MAG: hypothetical protein K6T83_01330 [Alicyclobacillus sp.]|nr:hypothetical protein [Alicyclobacillus sp.]
MSEAVRPLRVLWWSRHPPTEGQITVLEQRLAPERGVELVQINRSAQSAKEIVNTFLAVGADEMVVVLPLDILAELMMELDSRGLTVRPLRAVMDRTVHAGGDVLFCFRRFERILRVEVETCPL